jgi:hypothetical protein
MRMIVWLAGDLTKDKITPAYIGENGMRTTSPTEGVPMPHLPLD